jgi:bifunctional DNase/RNase
VIALELIGVRLEMPGRVHVVFLREREGERRVLPIYIGDPEAASIQIGMSGKVPPRPLTHDLMVDVLGSLGADLDKVVITDVSEGTFFAELHLKSRQGPLTVSARPSDAIAVAVRAGCGIYVDESVMDTAGRIAQFDDDDSDQAPGEVDELVDEFRDFIDSIKPEDFAP